MPNETKSSVSRKKAASSSAPQSKTARRTAASSGPDAKRASQPATGADAARPGRGTPTAGIKNRYLQQTPPEESFADGAHGVTMARNVLKLDLYRVVRYDQENEEEQRNISHRIVLPMTAVPELVNLLQGIVQAVQGAANQQQARPGDPQVKKDQAPARPNREAPIAQVTPPETSVAR